MFDDCSNLEPDFAECADPSTPEGYGGAHAVRSAGVARRASGTRANSLPGRSQYLERRLGEPASWR
eukprot:8096086-Pyramimonas_sp.AAC.1